MNTQPSLRRKADVIAVESTRAMFALRCLGAAVSLFALAPVAAQEALEKYYVHYCSLNEATTGYSPSACKHYSFTDAIPRVDRPKVSYRRDLPTGPANQQFKDVQWYAEYRQQRGSYPALPILNVVAELALQCSPLRYPQPFIAGSVNTQGVTAEYANGCFSTQPVTSNGGGTFIDQHAFGKPIRRKAYDGGIYEASPMVQTRNNNPWLTLYWGLNLGLVESQLDWDGARLLLLPEFRRWPGFVGKEYEFVLLTLPPPIIEGEITEYQNTLDFPNAPGGVYFYAANGADRAVLDSGAPGKWSRTGSKFNSGGYVSVCRFYGSVSPGPNSHFYTADDKECDVLKALQITPTPLSRQQLNFEGKTFSASVPTPAAVAGSSPVCPVKSMPLYRAYNAAYTAAGKKNYDSNHRFTTSRADINEVVAKGWVDEGVVMCVPE